MSDFDIDGEWASSEQMKFALKVIRHHVKTGPNWPGNAFSIDLNAWMKEAILARQIEEAQEQFDHVQRELKLAFARDVQGTLLNAVLLCLANYELTLKEMPE